MGLASLEAEVETLDRVGEGTNRDEVYALLGIVADGIVGDTARRLRLIQIGRASCRERV